MSEKFRNRYRIQSARAPWWDYGGDATYFITIITKNRQPFFGNIVAGKMQLSHLGVIADLLWYEIKNHAKNCDLGEFVVMPDHVHGVLILQGNNSFADGSKNVGAPNDRLPNVMTQNVETKHALSLHFASQPIGPSQPITKQAHRLGFEFAWQPRFYDRIIRDDAELQRISDYIRRNVQNWNAENY